jgi:hypothetical protein
MGPGKNHQATRQRGELNGSDCMELRALMDSCGTLRYGEEQIELHLDGAIRVLEGVHMNLAVKSSLHAYCENLVRP